MVGEINVQRVSHLFASETTCFSYLNIRALTHDIHCQRYLIVCTSCTDACILQALASSVTSLLSSHVKLFLGLVVLDDRGYSL